MDGQLESSARLRETGEARGANSRMHVSYAHEERVHHGLHVRRERVAQPQNRLAERLRHFESPCSVLVHRCRAGRSRRSAHRARLRAQLRREAREHEVGLHLGGGGEGVERGLVHVRLVVSQLQLAQAEDALEAAESGGVARQEETPERVEALGAHRHLGGDRLVHSHAQIPLGALERTTHACGHASGKSRGQIRQAESLVQSCWPQRNTSG
eukprot:1167826-Pleurochrysis_carterae.AAC.3